MLARLLMALAVCAALAGDAVAGTRVVALSNGNLDSPDGSRQLRDTRSATLAPGGDVWVLGQASVETCTLLSCTTKTSRGWIAQIGPDGSIRYELATDLPAPTTVDSLVLNLNGAAQPSLVGSIAGAIDLYPFLLDDAQELLIDPDRGLGAFTKTHVVPNELWTFPLGGAPQRIATGGEAAPGADGTFAERRPFSRLSYGPGGDLLFSGGLAHSASVDESNDSGVWRHDGLTTELLVREGDPAPGVPGWRLGKFGEPNAGGVIVIDLFPPTGGADFSSSEAGYTFQAKLELPGFKFTSESGLWVDRGGGPELITRTSLPAPGGAGGFFGPESGYLGPGPAFSRPEINGLGEVYFTANVFTPQASGYSLTTPSHEGLWKQGPDRVLHAVAVAGEPAPGVSTPPGGSATLQRFEDFFVNNAGQALFAATAQIESIGEDSYPDRTREDGLWIASPEGVRLVAVLQEGVDYLHDSALNPLALSDAGQAVFETLSDFGDDYTLALSATDRNGVPVEIVRWGDAIDVGAPGTPDVRVVESYTFFDIDDAGRVLFQAKFEDRSTALLISDAAAVPEPGAVALLLTAGLLAVARRHGV